MGFESFLVALMADIMAANRKLLEDIRYSVKQAFTSGENNSTFNREGKRKG